MERIEIQTYEEIQDCLRVRLMDMKSNKETLADTVYEPVGCGFALVAYLERPEEIFSGRIVDFPRRLAEATGHSLRRIMMDARLGSMAADYPKLCSLQGVLLGIENGDTPQNLFVGGEMPDDNPMLVLSTEDGILGAAALYYPGAQKRIGEIVGCNYYVLPSSVHEVLILPDDGQVNAKELAMLVKDINEREVPTEDRLGNKVLYFRTDIQKLQVAAELDQEKELGKERC